MSIIETILVIVGLTLGTAAILGSLNSDPEKMKQAMLAIEIICLLPWISLLILLMVGLCKNKARLVFPHFIASGFMGILLVAELLWVIIAYEGEISAIIFCIFPVAVCFFTLWIKWRCYKYLQQIQLRPSTTNSTDSVTSFQYAIQQ